MASISSLSSQVNLFNPLPRTHKFIRIQQTCMRTYAMRKDNDRSFSGKLVDENLIVLRKRIHEMKVIESNYEPPSDWMDWEKQIYASYDSIVCDSMVHLQSCLMEIRPSLALGMIALVGLSVPISAVVVMFNLLEITKGLVL